MSVEVADDVKQWVAEEAYEPQFGARPLKRFVQRQIETPLARLLIQNDMAEGAKVVVTMDNGQPKLVIE